MAAKDKYEYIKLEEPHLIREDMSQISSDFAQEITNANNFQVMLQEKHKCLSKAKLLAGSMKQELRALQALTHKEELAQRNETPAKKRTASEDDVRTELVNSKRALENLSSNIQELKKHLGA